MFNFFRKTDAKIFCISFQRTGTTSVGEFFKQNGYKVATWEVAIRNNWPKLWFDGDYETIFNSSDFKKSRVFEDSPWWFDNAYKVLFHRFPDAKFVLFIRNSNLWYDSMMSHSGGKTLGNTYRHAHNYRREKEFYDKFPDYQYNKDTTDNLLDLNESHRKHYTEIYENRHKSVIAFFERYGQDRLILVSLEDKDKWLKLANFFKIDIDSSIDIHANASKK
jgi:hypothetical protein